MRGLSRTPSSRRAYRQAGIAGMCALVAAAAACSSSSGSTAASGAPVTLKYWTSSKQSEIDYLDTQFDRSHPGIKVVGQYIASSDDSTAKDIAAIKSGTEPNVILGGDPAALPLTDDKRIVMQCGSGKRSAMAIERCRAAGHKLDSHLGGGIMAWKAAGLPTISLDSESGLIRDRG